MEGPIRLRRQLRDTMGTTKFQKKLKVLNLGGKKNQDHRRSKQRHKDQH